MSTYREIHGKAIKSLDTDPTAETDAGQIWYNTSSNTFKSIVQLEAWRSGAPYPRSADHTAGSGTQTAALSCSDTIPHPSADITSTFEYNGSGWSAGGSMNTGRGDGFNNMTGSQTASFYVAGRPNASPPTPFGSTATEEYDGSSWTAGGAYPAGLRAANAFGTLTAGVNAGGNSSSPSVSSNVNNEYNGTSWTSGNNNTLGRFNASSSGTSTAGILVAGFSNPPPVVNSVTEEYDGSSWTSGGSLPEGRNGLGGSGTQTANIVFGGSSPPGTKQTTTSKYDGTSWTTSPATLATAIEKFGSAKGGSQTATLAWCGVTTTDATEEYDSSANVITAAAWASGGNMPGNFYGFSGRGVGTQTASLSMGGNNPVVTTINKYDGSSWTANPSGLNTARRSGALLGTQTAALMAGGYLGPPGAFSNAAEEFDGSSASAQNNLPYNGSSNFGFGTQTAAAVAGGYAPPFPSLVSTNAEYDGTNWTSATALPAARGLGGSAGQAQTTGLVWAGLAPSQVNTTLEYDGTNWTSGGTYGESKSNIQGWGDQTSAIGAGGEGGGDSTNTFVYDGTTWATQPSLPGARKQAGTGGTSSASGLIFGGETPPITNATIEFTGETTAVNVKTLTQS